MLQSFDSRKENRFGRKFKTRGTLTFTVSQTVLDLSKKQTFPTAVLILTRSTTRMFSPTSDPTMATNKSKLETIEKSCDKIISAVRSSCLNFAVQETPFSIYFTIRKSLRKSSNLDLYLNQTKEVVHDSKIEILESKIASLQNTIETISRDYEESVDKAEALVKKNDTLEKQIEVLNENLFDAEHNIDTIVVNKVKAINSEKREIQTKHEKISLELKNLKHENSDLVEQIKNIKIALKSSKEESRELSGTYVKEIKLLEVKLNNLETFKAEKIGEEKELKSKLKKVDKKSKKLQ